MTMEWISVEERLPDRKDVHKYFLCRCIQDGDNSEQWAYYLVLRWNLFGHSDNGDYYHPHFQDEGHCGMSVTHWMPLPPPPEK